MTSVILDRKPHGFKADIIGEYPYFFDYSDEDEADIEAIKRQIASDGTISGDTLGQITIRPSW